MADIDILVQAAAAAATPDASSRIVGVKAGAAVSFVMPAGGIPTDKTGVGLSNVDNTSDASKPISSATVSALAGKEPTIAAGIGGQYWDGTKTWQTLPTSSVPSYTWAAKPAASSVSAGTQIRVTDVGTSSAGTKWESDGAIWRPLNGRTMIFSKSGSYASPLATLGPNIPNNTFFAIPGGAPKFQAGLLNTGSVIHAEGFVYHRTGPQGIYMSMWFGTSSTTADSKPLGNAVGGGYPARAINARLIVSGTNKIVSSGWLEDWSNSYPGNDYTTNINTASEMTMNIGIETPNTDDVMDLISLNVWLEN